MGKINQTFAFLLSFTVAALSMSIAIGLIVGKQVTVMIALYWVTVAVKNLLALRKNERHDPY